MPVSYTFENDIIWVAMQGKPVANEIINTLQRAFKDRKFTPKVTSIIYNLAILNRQTTYSRKDRKILASFLIASPINRSAAIVSDPIWCEAVNKYREYLAEDGVQHAAFCMGPGLLRFCPPVVQAAQATHASPHQSRDLP